MTDLIVPVCSHLVLTAVNCVETHNKLGDVISLENVSGFFCTLPSALGKSQHSLHDEQVMHQPVLDVDFRDQGLCHHLRVQGLAQKIRHQTSGRLSAAVAQALLPIPAKG